MRSACCFPTLESLLGDSTSRFLAAFSADADADADPLSKFYSIFARVLNIYHDPPLEAVWFFYAVVFHNNPDDPRNILHLLSGCTASSPTAAKPLALLAPVISELFHSAKPRRKIEALVEAVFKYISNCSSHPTGGEVDADTGRLLPVFGELVKVWSVRISRDRCPFQVIFPLVGDHARRELMKEGCSVSFLAGVVLAEAFLLRLCLKVQGAAGVPRSELQNELRTWAVSSIPVFQNQQFFGVLLNMLVNPPLPVYSPLRADDEILVRDVLYDALILMDNSVLSAAQVDQADSSLFPFFVSRLVITVDAINDARRKGDQGRAMSYINTFSTSNIPSYLTRLAIRQAGTDQLGKPIAITPQAFLEWLVDLADKGLMNASRCHGRVGKASTLSRFSWCGSFRRRGTPRYFNELRRRLP